MEERLFSCGFEVELIPLDAGISKVVVGKITSMEKQEGTHLTKCVVDCGEYGHEIHISTGAANMSGRLRPRRPGWLHPCPAASRSKALRKMQAWSQQYACSGEEPGLNDDLFPGSGSTACSSCPRILSPAPTLLPWWVWTTISLISPSPRTARTASPFWASPAK